MQLLLESANDNKKLICLIKEPPGVIGAAHEETAAKFSLLIKDKVTGEKMLRDFINIDVPRTVSTQMPTVK